jgi:hypothetical protein
MTRRPFRRSVMSGRVTNLAGSSLRTGYLVSKKAHHRTEPGISITTASASALLFAWVALEFRDSLRPEPFILSLPLLIGRGPFFYSSLETKHRIEPKLARIVAFLANELTCMEFILIYLPWSHAGTKS